MQNAIKSRFPSWLLAAIALLAGVISYRAIPSLGFVTYDDPVVVYDNPMVQRGISWEGIVWAVSTGHHANWHPLTWMSLMLDSNLYGIEPLGYHLSNLLFHLVSVWFVFLIFKRLAGSNVPAFIGATIFSVHPLNVQTVAWVGERKGGLSGLFFFLTVALYLSCAKKTSPWKYTCLLSAFIAGLLSKQMGVTLPLIFLLLDAWPLKRVMDNSSFKRVLLEKIPFIVLAIVFIAIAYYAQLSGGGVGREPKHGLSERIFTAISAPGFYLAKFFYPVDLSFHYHNYGNFPSPIHLLLSIFLGVCLVFCVVRRKYPWVVIGGLWFVLTLLPICGIIQIGKHRHADRYIYIPMVGLLLPVSMGAHELIKKHPRIGSASFCVAILPLGVKTDVEVHHWRDSRSLYNRAIQVDPRNPVAMNNRGVLYADATSHPKAIVDFRSALQVDPNYFAASRNLAFSLAELGEFSDAEAVYRQQLVLHPGNAALLQNLGGVLSRQGKLTEAAETYRELISKHSSSWEVMLILAETLAKTGNWVEAEAYYSKYIEVSPDSIHAVVGLSRTLAKQGQFKEAAGVLRNPLAANPRQIDLLAAIAWLMINSEDESSATALHARQLSDRLIYSSPPDIPWTLYAWCAVMHHHGHSDSLANGLKLLLETRDAVQNPSLAEEIDTLLKLIEMPTVALQAKA